MAREIKFRAWDGEKMHTNVGIIPSSCSLSIQVHDQTIFIRPNTWKVMQFTGLKDKNEKEIYEGDILRVLDYPSEEEAESMIGAVEYYNSTFDMVLKKKENPLESTRFRWGNFYHVEVIGNIYENPKLLEEPVKRTIEDFDLKEVSVTKDGIEAGGEIKKSSVSVCPHCGLPLVCHDGSGFCPPGTEEAGGQR